MHSAYKHADGKKIDGRRVLVDVERGRTVKGWLPRRLGGGLGGTRRGADHENTRHSGRDDTRSRRDDGRRRSRERRRILVTLVEMIPGADVMMVGEGQGRGIGGGAGAGTGAAGRDQGPGTGRGARGQGAGQGSAGGRRGRRRVASRSRMSQWTTRTSLKTGPTSTCRE